MVQVLERKEMKVFIPVAEEKQKITEEKPAKKGLLKFLKKSKYNPKYHEELIPVEKVRDRTHYNNYGVF